MSDQIPATLVQVLCSTYRMPGSRLIQAMTLCFHTQYTVYHSLIARSFRAIYLNKLNKKLYRYM